MLEVDFCFLRNMELLLGFEFELMDLIKIINMYLKAYQYYVII